MNMNLSSARIFVRDLEEAARFYGEKLGFAQSAGGIEHGACIYETGGMQLVVEAVAPDAPQDEQALIGRYTGLCFAVDDSSLYISTCCPSAYASVANQSNKAGVAGWTLS
jgi:catechol 2,3-dioxygenase-like lactoylglutathione lyase family enzyme